MIAGEGCEIIIKITIYMRIIMHWSYINCELYNHHYGLS